MPINYDAATLGGSAQDLSKIIMAALAQPSQAELVAKENLSRDPYARDPGQVALHQLLQAGVDPSVVHGMSTAGSNPEMLILQTLMDQMGQGKGIGQFYDYKNKGAIEQIRALKDIEAARIRADATKGAAHEGAVAAVLKSAIGMGLLDPSDQKSVMAWTGALRSALGSGMGGGMLQLPPKPGEAPAAPAPAPAPDEGGGDLVVEMRNGQPWIVNKPAARPAAAPEKPAAKPQSPAPARPKARAAGPNPVAQADRGVAGGAPPAQPAQPWTLPTFDLGQLLAPLFRGVETDPSSNF